MQRERQWALREFKSFSVTSALSLVPLLWRDVDERETIPSLSSPFFEFFGYLRICPFWFRLIMGGAHRREATSFISQVTLVFKFVVAYNQILQCENLLHLCFRLVYLISIYFFLNKFKK